MFPPSSQTTIHEGDSPLFGGAKSFIRSSQNRNLFWLGNSPRAICTMSTRGGLPSCHIMRYCSTNSIPLEFLQRARLHRRLTAISSGPQSWPHSVATVGRRPLDRTECSRQLKRYFVQHDGSTIADAPPFTHTIRYKGRVNPCFAPMTHRPLCISGNADRPTAKLRYRYPIPIGFAAGTPLS